jgi:hypothetical protein
VRPSLWPLFLVSAAAVGIEIALTRYFAVAKWSEYGYWVISIVMVGFALSGVVMALGRGWAERHGRILLAVLPALLIASAAGGYWLTTINPFNPLQLQNAATWQPQIGNIALYYAALLPFFFLTGLYVSLSFVLNEARVPRVYGYDLTGAGIGAALVLGLMALLHPFLLVPALLVPLAVAAFLGPWRRRAGLAALLVLAGAEGLLLLDGQAAFNDFKAIYAPLHVPDARVLVERPTPRGLYMLLDDFTERVDTDVSNDAGQLGVSGPPATYGLYRDGNRIAALPRTDGATAPYAKATLDAVAYNLPPNARVMIAGASGGFRIALARALGARLIDALEPDPLLRDALAHGLGPVPPLPADPAVRVLATSPLAQARRAVAADERYDLIDISADFLDESEANSSAFAAESIAAELNALTPEGVLSLPVSIREFPVYALRMLATVRDGLRQAGIEDAAAHVVVVRSAWNVRILVSPAAWSAARIDVVKKFCDDRSFDVSYYPGIDIAAARAGIYNDLPAVSFDAGEVASGGGPADAIADEAEQVLRGLPTASAASFDLRPITLDRPFYYNILRLDHLGTLLRRLELLPQAEIGALVNVAVLVQAVLIAILVLLVPLLFGGRVRAGQGGLLRPILYFSALGLGFLFLEIFLIDKASFYLNDRTSAFALVLTGMLIFSGLGSMQADRFSGSLLPVSCVVIAWCVLVSLFLQPLMLATLELPVVFKGVLVLVLIAPLSLALGLPFPLGLKRAGVAGTGFLPWAWGLNGALSVVATPLANLMALAFGYEWVLFTAALLYAGAQLAYPSERKSLTWQKMSAT